MELTEEDRLAERSCRAMLRDGQYTPERSRQLIGWVTSDWHPTFSIARRTLATLGPRAFDDLFAAALAQGERPDRRFIAALEAFTSEHDRLLPRLRQWLSAADGDLRLQCAISLARVAGERARQGKAVEADDIAAFRSVLVPASATNSIVRIHLRDYDRAVSEKA